MPSPEPRPCQYPERRHDSEIAITPEHSAMRRNTSLTLHPPSTSRAVGPTPSASACGEFSPAKNPRTLLAGDPRSPAQDTHSPPRARGPQLAHLLRTSQSPRPSRLRESGPGSMTTSSSRAVISSDCAPALVFATGVAPGLWLALKLFE